MSVATSNPFINPASVGLNSSPITYLGEVVAWELPTNAIVKHADLVAALTAAGLDPRHARLLCVRHAFVRAVRAVAKGHVVRVKYESDDYIECQATDEKLKDVTTDTLNFGHKITLDKTSGLVSCADSTMQVNVQNELRECLENRHTSDITRILQNVFADNADLFPIKNGSGVYFVPQAGVGFLAKVEVFMLAVHGTFSRFPVPEGTPQAAASVQTAVVDGLDSLIGEYESFLDKINAGMRDGTLDAAFDAMSRLQEKIFGYSNYLGSHQTRLEDHLAYVRKLIADRAAEVKPQSTFA